MERGGRKEFLAFAGALAWDLLLGLGVVVVALLPHLVSMVLADEGGMDWQFWYLVALAFLGGVVASARRDLRAGLWPLLILLGLVVGESVYPLTDTPESASILDRGIRETGTQLGLILWIFYLSLLAGGGAHIFLAWIRAPKAADDP